MVQDFNSIYSQIEPSILQLEEKRKKLKAQGCKKGGTAGGILFLTGIIISVYAGGGWLGAIMAFIIALLVIFSYINAQSAELSAYYKKNIISVLLTSLCKDIQYLPESGISQATFSATGLFATTPDRYRSEDRIAGQLDKTTFHCAEIIAEEKRVTVNSKGCRSEHWVDIFRGFLFMADFHKNFNGQTIVFRNSWLKLHSGGRRVKLENPDFEKNFDVYSTDQVEARYILTPVMMEKLLTLDRKFPGKITVSFFNSQVIIAIPDSCNHFEAGIWRTMKSQTIEKEFHTLAALIGIVDDLNLNLRIWSKE